MATVWKRDEDHIWYVHFYTFLIALIAKDCGMSLAGAQTYYYNALKKV